jgi:flagellar basal body-associated protein FliL
MNKNTLLVLGIVIKILIVAVGVAFMYRGKPETTTTTVSSTTAPQTPTFKGEVKVGILLPLNIPVAQQMLESYKITIEDINAKGCNEWISLVRRFSLLVGWWLFGKA